MQEATVELNHYLLTAMVKVCKKYENSLEKHCSCKLDFEWYREDNCGVDNDFKITWAEECARVEMEVRRKEDDGAYKYARRQMERLK